LHSVVSNAPRLLHRWLFSPSLCFLLNRTLSLPHNPLGPRTRWLPDSHHGAQKVLVMVPTLALVEQQQQPPVAKATYPTYYQKQMVHQTMVPDYPQYIHSPILDQHNVYSPNGGSSAWGEPLRSLPVSMSAPHINLDVSKRTSHSSTKPADGNNATGLMGFFNSAGHFGGGSAGEGGRC